MATNNQNQSDYSNFSNDELDKRKKIADLKNAEDYYLGRYEKYVKRRIVPVFIPILTFVATVCFFSINWYDNKKS